MSRWGRRRLSVQKIVQDVAKYPEIVASVKAHLGIRDVRPWQPGDGDSRCQECGHPYEPWFTDHWVWNLVVGGPDATDDPGGYLCPLCFTTQAIKVEPRAIWRLTPECYHFGKKQEPES